MGRYNGNVYVVMQTYNGQVKDNTFKKNLVEAYMEDIAKGSCNSLFEIYELTKDIPGKTNVEQYIESSFAPIEVQSIIDVYNKLNDKKTLTMPKLTREKVVYLYNLLEENRKRLNDDEYVCDVKAYSSQNDSEKNAEGGATMFFDVQPQDMGVNPYTAKIEELRNIVLQRDNQIQTLGNKCKGLENQLRDLDNQFQTMKKGFEDRTIALEAEYKKKNDDFAVYVTDEKAKLETELKVMREAEAEILEEKRRNKEAEFEKYYQAEKQKAQQEVEEYIAQEKAAADAKAQQWLEDSFKGKVSEYLNEKETAWKDGYNEFDGVRQNIANSIGAAKLEYCNEASRIQREFMEQMNESMAQFGANMDKWRNSMYSINFEDFATWISRFFGFVDRFDKRIVDTTNNGEPSPDMVRFGKTLVSLRNQLDRVMPGMGLRCYYPESGENFDPVYHEVDTDEAVGMDAEILECKNPGVEMGLADSSSTRVLVKAEVSIKE